jgi:hypothetical protein
MTSTEYYRNNPGARKRKASTDKKINSRPEQVRKRVEANKARRKARRKGLNIRGLDYDHATRRFVRSALNRGRRGEGNR